MKLLWGLFGGCFCGRGGSLLHILITILSWQHCHTLAVNVGCCLCRNGGMFTGLVTDIKKKDKCLRGV